MFPGKKYLYAFSNTEQFVCQNELICTDLNTKTLLYTNKGEKTILWLILQTLKLTVVL